MGRYERGRADLRLVLPVRWGRRRSVEVGAGRARRHVLAGGHPVRLARWSPTEPHGYVGASPGQSVYVYGATVPWTVGTFCRPIAEYYPWLVPCPARGHCWEG